MTTEYAQQKYAAGMIGAGSGPDVQTGYPGGAKVPTGYRPSHLDTPGPNVPTPISKGDPPLIDVLAKRLVVIDQQSAQMAERAASLANRLGLPAHGPEPSDQPQQPGMLGALASLLARIEASARLLDHNLRELERL